MLHQLNNLNEVLLRIHACHTLLYHRIEPVDEQILICLSLFNRVPWCKDIEELLHFSDTIVIGVGVVQCLHQLVFKLFVLDELHATLSDVDEVGGQKVGGSLNLVGKDRVKNKEVSGLQTGDVLFGANLG